MVVCLSWNCLGHTKIMLDWLPIVRAGLSAVRSSLADSGYANHREVLVAQAT